MSHVSFIIHYSEDGYKHALWQSIKMVKKLFKNYRPVSITSVSWRRQSSATRLLVTWNIICFWASNTASYLPKTVCRIFWYIQIVEKGIPINIVYTDSQKLSATCHTNFYWERSRKHPKMDKAFLSGRSQRIRVDD